MLSAISILCSLVAANSCGFISFEDADGNSTKDPPFDVATAAQVGIFRYQITIFSNTTFAPMECIQYDDRWAQQLYYPSLSAAQFCALFAPIIAGFGVLITILEFCICHFSCSILISGTLYLLAAGIQLGTFVLVADPVFW